MKEEVIKTDKQFAVDASNRTNLIVTLVKPNCDIFSAYHTMPDQDWELNEAFGIHMSDTDESMAREYADYLVAYIAELRSEGKSFPTLAYSLRSHILVLEILFNNLITSYNLDEYEMYYIKTKWA